MLGRDVECDRVNVLLTRVLVLGLAVWAIAAGLVMVGIEI